MKSVPRDPHCIALFLIYIGPVAVVIVAWYVILVTGRYPRGLFEYVEGVMRRPTGLSATPSSS